MNNFFHVPASSIIFNIIIFHDYLIIFICSIIFSSLTFIILSSLLKEFFIEIRDNNYLEFIWTVTPIFILIALIFPSMKLIFFMDSCFFCGLTLIILGHQWYWRYFFKGINLESFDSYIINKRTLFRLLEVDNNLILPFRIPIRLLCSSSDVIHSWTIPSLGVKIDAIPGRINQFCFTLIRSGLFFGQCSEICGINHSFIPIVLERVRIKDFFNL